MSLATDGFFFRGREWALLVPAYSIILILLTYFTYWALAFSSTPAFNDLRTITGPFREYLFLYLKTYSSLQTHSHTSPWQTNLIRIYGKVTQMLYQRCMIFPLGW